nr:Retrovirus-related Pol polyprotein from transposon 17.6 [Ipomoea batatas]
MATHKERIEVLEANVTEINEGLSKLLAEVQKLTESVHSRHDSAPASPSSNAQQGRTTGSGTESGKSSFLPRFNRLEFPKFSGDDPTEWCNRVAQFFEFHDVPESQRVAIAAYHLEGKANQWWQWVLHTYTRENREITWSLFEEELWARFGPPEGTDFNEALKKLQQTGSLHDYHEEFERLGNRVHGWSEEALLGVYMGGLKSELADVVRMFRPKILRDAMAWARMKDDQLQRVRRSTRPLPYTRPGNVAHAPDVGKSVKRLSWEEMQRRKSQGLCFSCNEKFTPGHRCAKPQLMLLEYADEGDEVVSPPHVETHEDDALEISLHALSGWSAQRTMRLPAQIFGRAITVLVDSGSTHNFIRSKLAEQLQLPFTPMDSFNGVPLRCEGHFDGVTVEIQNVHLPITFFSLPLVGIDAKLSMSFTWNNQPIVLEGLGTPSPQAMSLESLTSRIEDGAYLFMLYPLTADLQTKDGTNIPPDMWTLLNQFADLFEEPTNLPPRREIEHHIHLREGADAVNHNWVAKLLGYDYEILYRPGKANQAADALSRCSHRVDDDGLHSASPAIMTISTAHATTWDQLTQEVQSDPYLQKLVIKSLQNLDGPYSMRNGLVFFKHRIVVSPTSSLISQQSPNFCMSSTLPPQQDIPGSSAHSSASLGYFIGHQCFEQWKPLRQRVMCVNVLKHHPYPPQAYSNHYLFQNVFGTMLLWTSSMGYPRPTARPLFWLWLID